MSLRQELEEVLGAHNLAPKKGFGQNFLVDPSVLDSIAKFGLEAADGPIIEIGPGPGTLTERLLRGGRQVTAIEKDPAMIQVLHARLGEPAKLTVIQANAVQADLHAYSSVARVNVVGNIPYNISSPLLFRLIEQRRHLGPVTLLVQTEVAERWAAKPGNKTYGIPSVLLQMRADVRLLRKVGSGAFYPPPRVQSTLVRIHWHSEARFEWTPERHCDAVVRTGFGKRRKMLRNALSLHYSKEELQAVDDAGFSLNRRAEVLELAQWSKLAQALLSYRELTSHAP